MGEERNGRLLLIDDDVEFCLLVKDYLELQNIALDYYVTGEEGLDALGTKNYDLILLDMMLPDLPGVEVLRRIRVKSGIPVIIFSAHNDETDRIVTLELGADDYVPKSFSSRELLARIRAVLRRSAGKEGSEREEILTAHGIELNPRTLRASFHGQAIELTYVEFQLLHAMMREPGRIFSRETLLNLFADKEWNKFDRSVDVHISTLRKKLADATGMNSHIRTVRSMGYVFIRQEEDDIARQSPAIHKGPDAP